MRVGLLQSRPHHHFIECNLFSPGYSCKKGPFTNYIMKSLPVSNQKVFSFFIPLENVVYFWSALIHLSESM